MTHQPVRIFSLAVLTQLLTITVSAHAQSPLIRSDAIELKRIGALAAVQRLQVSPRADFSPQVAFSQHGDRGCTFNIGDVASAQQADMLGPTAAPVPRRGLGRTEYITLVASSPVCVQR